MLDFFVELNLEFDRFNLFFILPDFIIQNFLYMLNPRAVVMLFVGLL